MSSTELPNNETVALENSIAPETSAEVEQPPQSFTDKAIACLEAAAQQRHVLALRDGMIASVPIILVGSTFLLLGAQGPILEQYFSGAVSWLPDLLHTEFGQWYLANTQLIYLPYRLTMGLLALYIAFTIASALATQYKLPPVPQGLGAVAALLVTGTPAKVDIIETPIGPEWVIAAKPLGPEGIFLAIILGIVMVEVSRLLVRPQKASPDSDSEKLKNSIPPSVSAAFQSFLPMLLVVTVVWGIRHVSGFDINNIILRAMSPLHSLGDSLGAVVVANFFLHLFSVAGVHGVSVINAAMLPLWQQYVVANAEAHSAGLPLPHVTAYPFYQWFIWIGGAGATMAPTIMIMFMKNEHMRKVGKMAIVPALFNVNEPFLFGIPVVANPLLAIPCVVAPIICGIIAYFAVASGLVSAPFIEVPWVMPCFLGAILSTQDWRSLVLLAVNFAVSGCIWYPFLRIYKARLESA